jgi:hypothetical protein
MFLLIARNAAAIRSLKMLPRFVHSGADEISYWPPCAVAAVGVIGFRISPR